MIKGPIAMGAFYKLAQSLLCESKKRRLDSNETAARNEKLQKEWNAAKLYQSLTDWAAAPRFAPDRVDGKPVANPLADWQRAIINNEDLQDTAKEMAERLNGSRAFSLFLKMHPEIGELLKRLKELSNK